MKYVCIVLILTIVFLAVHLCLLHKAIRRAADDMEEIEKRPERNRQLKSLSIDSSLERLLAQINSLYQARQKERIRIRGGNFRSARRSRISPMICVLPLPQFWDIWI